MHLTLKPELLKIWWVSCTGVSADVFEPFDLVEHTLELHLDVYNEVQWVRSDYQPSNFSINIKYCMQSQLEFLGRCGCSGMRDNLCPPKHGHGIKTCERKRAPQCKHEP